jgi:two-component system heavy metal sensor histidine kinase CusS
MVFRSITFRLTLYFAVASTIVLMAIAYLVGCSVDMHFVELDRAELHGKLELVRHALAKVRAPGDVDALPDRMGDALAGHDALAVALFAPGGTRLFSTQGSDFPPSFLQSALQAGKEPELQSWRAGSHNYRGFTARVPVESPELPFVTVALSLNTDEHHRFTLVLYRSLWLAVAAGILVISMLGWIAVRRGLAPVRELADVVHRVSARRLGDRLPLDTQPVELFELATAFNEMLSRLEGAFQRLTEFSSDLAHELRTPVANMMTQTQVALSRARTADEYREVLYSNAEEFDRMARMISDMLYLAQSDNGFAVPRGELVDLDKEVRDLFEFYDALAEDRGVRLTTSGEASVYGNRLMLRRALSNLLSNAMNHSSRGGTVDVRVESIGGTGARLTVENQGETIPAEHLGRLFDRFYRIDPSRQRVTDGAGLGLAITKAIVTAHHGTIAATSTAGRTTFEILLAPNDSGGPP